MKNSKFLRLNWADLLKGFLVAFLAFFIAFLQDTFIPALNLAPEVKLMLLTGLAYLTKNLFQSGKNDAGAVR